MRPDLVTQAYSDFAPYVRRALLAFGVREPDLPDMCHEVFLIVHRRSAALDDVERLDLWLREICRRVAAGYRRRAAHRREVLSPDPDPDVAGALLGDRGDDAEDLEPMRRALARLDDESRDLLALHDAGDMSLFELAKLVERDRRSVRKRLELARRRLAALLREHESAGHPSDLGMRTPESSAEPPAPPLLGGFEVVAVTQGVNIGLVGNVVVSTWPDVATLEAMETLLEHGQRLIKRCGGKIGYLAVVEASVRPPPLAARQKIVESLDIMGPSVLGYATALLGGMAWIAQPIMSGLMLLARPRFPMRFFKGVEPAAAWLCQHFARGADGPLPLADLCATAEHLRTLRP
jgi:RNA polymerase sigma-70 factor (ECF subfamily)